MFKKKKRNEGRGKTQGRKGGKKKRKIKLTTTDSEWPYMKTSAKQSDLALSLLGDNSHHHDSLGLTMLQALC